MSRIFQIFGLGISIPYFMRYSGNRKKQKKIKQIIFLMWHINIKFNNHKWGSRLFGKGHVLGEPVHCCLTSSTAAIYQLVFNVHKPCSRSAGLKHYVWLPVTSVALRGLYNEGTRITVIFEQIFPAVLRTPRPHSLGRLLAVALPLSSVWAL